MSLYKNIHAKRKRIKAGSKEKMRKPGTKGAPTAKAFKAAAKTAKKRKSKKENFFSVTAGLSLHPPPRLGFKGGYMAIIVFNIMQIMRKRLVSH